VGGGDELANRALLHAGHHLRGVHAGRVRVIGSAPKGLRFELGLRPGQPPLLRYRSGDQLSAPAARVGSVRYRRFRAERPGSRHIPRSAPGSSASPASRSHPDYVGASLSG
jgi:hypothetical protein